MASQRDNRVKVSALLIAGHKVSEVANHVSLAQQSMRSRSAWAMVNVSTDMQAVVERLLYLEWHPASYHDPQQSFAHCLHVCLLTPSLLSMRFLIG